MRKSMRLRLPLRLPVWMALACSAYGQGRTPSDLVKFITFQVDRPGREAFLMGMSNCGQENGDDEAVRSLVGLGPSAIPAIERAFLSVESEGARSPFAPNSSTLFDVYARIKGRAAFRRLERMLHRPRLEFLVDPLDRAIASSLALTSHVSVSRGTGRTFDCRGPQPRESLDQLGPESRTSWACANNH